jgi:HSP20 family protein
VVRIRKGLAGELEEFHQRMERIMEAALEWHRRGRTSTHPDWCPAADLYETAGEVVILMEAAGVSPASLEITLEGTLLRVAGERPAEHLQAGCIALHQMEIERGPFERLFTVPPGLDGDAARARLEAGFLEVRIPKTGGSPASGDREQRP